MWDQDEHDGKTDRTKGKVKEVVGGLIQDDELKAERQGGGERRGNRGLGAPQGRACDRESQKRREDQIIMECPITDIPPPRFSPHDSTKGNNGYYLISDGGTMAYRVRIRTPSFPHMQMLPAITRGVMVPDLLAILGAMDYVLADIDR